MHYLHLIDVLIASKTGYSRCISAQFGSADELVSHFILSVLISDYSSVLKVKVESASHFVHMKSKNSLFFVMFLNTPFSIFTHYLVGFVLVK